MAALAILLILDQIMYDLHHDVVHLLAHRLESSYGNDLRLVTRPCQPSVSDLSIPFRTSWSTPRRSGAPPAPIMAHSFLTTGGGAHR